MTEDILKKMHGLHLMLADELKRICEKNNIKYFLLAGSMLGSVRHKGFIPWDDDMDFGMLRPEYEKFLKCCLSDLDKEKFYLQTDRTDLFYTFNFSKLRLKNTAVIEEFSQGTKNNQGIYIDIFPLDTVPNNRVKRAIQYRRFWYYRNLLWIKCGYGSEDRKKKFDYKVAKVLSNLYTIEKLKQKKYKIITKCSDEKSDNVVTGDGTYGLKKETLKRTWVENLKDYQFEDHVYPGISDSDAYLTYLYGDYMEVPPLDKRNHHSRLNVNFGPYGDDN